MAVVLGREIRAESKKSTRMFEVDEGETTSGRNYTLVLPIILKIKDKSKRKKKSIPAIKSKSKPLVKSSRRTIQHLPIVSLVLHENPRFSQNGRRQSRR